ncbi:peptidase S10 [Gluconacetobacter azotocaptans]|uniref:Peptidase S10 n=1 Tax=Gluconacetobacter azotocaptans TaxID=142834 RepID=A0A7W4JVH6_9PROT|nr:peptidase S10 [Gluconacetobacter azotocaptans]MBB2191673.1 peptidase S10 [Gluconacetobacter azotocaptans]GBQ33547.1 carboxypeptidase-like protein [Gluconacetobacter azotocaptans DSM 13594]
MTRSFLLDGVALAILAPCLVAMAPLSPARAEDHPAHADTPAKPASNGFDFTPQQKISDGSVTVRGQKIAYQAVAGTLVVHPRDWDDAAPEKKAKPEEEPVAAMFYVAYFKKGVQSIARPITFVYNGGPGSATVWLHMGAFGPRRIVTSDDSHTAAAPYRLVDNDDSLLDVTDLVFIDAPGTGFGRLGGKDKDKAFYGTDPDAWAFTDFIAQFLGRYGRFNSPKYLYGESYGTTRSAIVANMLKQDKEIDLNGVMLLSQILDYDNSIDRPQANPSVDQPYVLALPSFAATAWYHHKLPQQPADLKAFLHEVEQFALTDYAAALQEGTAISDAHFNDIATRLHAYTGLPVEYIKHANLRVNGGEFEKTLMGDEDIDTGRLDSRFSGASIDPLSQRPFYDPMDASMGAAYISTFNAYARDVLHYGGESPTGAYEEYKPSAHSISKWSFTHVQPDMPFSNRGLPNVLPDLAMAMKENPLLKVQLNQGYFDLGTPYFEGVFEMRHLPIPRRLAGNVEIHQYMSGHMVYAHAPALKELHDNAADFIRRTDNLPG